MAKVPRAVEQHRAMWRWTGRERPPWAEEPGPGQESVWDYPRPPRIAPDSREVIVRLGGEIIAQTSSAVRVLETAGGPVFYLPPTDVRSEFLELSPRSSHCEWKGRAAYWTVRVGSQLEVDVGWSYPDPYPEFESMRDYLSFYPGRLECTVDGERVRPQPGGFYGGWITDEIVGPIKGGPGSQGW